MNQQYAGILAWDRFFIFRMMINETSSQFSLSIHKLTPLYCLRLALVMVKHWASGKVKPYITLV